MAYKLTKIIQSEVALKESTKDILLKIADSEKYCDYSINAMVGSKVGDNFSSKIYRIEISGMKNGQNDQLKIIAKVPLDGQIADHVPIRVMFLKEILMYTKILTIFEDLQKNVTLSEYEQFKFIKCFATNITESNEIIVLRDLRADGFRLLHQTDTLDFEHCILALKALAKLHAFSFILRKREPETLKIFANEINDKFYFSQSLYDAKHFYGLIESAMKLVKEIIRDNKMLNKIEGSLEGLFESMMSSVTRDEYSVVCHADCGINNMLFKYENESPVEVCLLDYQVVRFASPVTDLHYVIFKNLNSKLRRKHFNTFLEVYHNCLRNFTEAFSVDIDEIYPKDKLIDDMKSNSNFAIGTVLLTFLFSTRNLDEISKNTNMVEYVNSMKERSKKKVTEVFSDFEYFSYI